MQAYNDSIKQIRQRGYLLAVSVACCEDSRAVEIIVTASSEQASQTEVSTQLWGLLSKWAWRLHSLRPQRVQVLAFHTVSDILQQEHFSCL